MFSQSKCKVDAEAIFRLPNNSLPAIAILTLTIVAIQDVMEQTKSQTKIWTIFV